MGRYAKRVIGQDLLNAVIKNIPPPVLTPEQIVTIASLIPTVDISGKVDKATGKSLVSDTDILKIHISGSDNQDLSGLVRDNDPRLIDARTPLTHTHDYEPANANIQTHVTAAHAPAGAQVNADITKAEIEAKLTGPISTHSHTSSGGLTQQQILRMI